MAFRYSWGHHRFRCIARGTFPPTPGPLAIAGNMEYLGSFRFRLGYAADRLFLYSTLGMAWTHDTLTIVTPAPIPFNLSNTQTHFGVAVGAGVEYAFLNNFSARLEYLYTLLYAGRYIFSRTSSPVGLASKPTSRQSEAASIICSSIRDEMLNHDRCVTSSTIGYLICRLC